MPHLVHRQCGITQEYSIADYIREHGQPELLENDTYFNGEVVLSFEAKNLTSLFGIQLLKSEIRKNTIILNLSINCLCGLSHELQGTGRPFDGFANLTILDLSHNQLTHLDPQLFAGLLNLRGLYLSDNQLTHLDPQLFAGLPNLTRLDLSHNQLTHLDPQALAGLPNLTELYLSNNQLTHLDPQLFSGLPNLRFLYLSNNQLTQDQKHRLQKELKRIRSLEL
jgi:Leucine-rich repeat (LRR) protein